MRSSNSTTPEIVDQAALSQIHAHILQQIELLDKLGAEFKVKQEEHFLRTFMNILETMGNDLILAQEAYRNVDIEIKRDKYYMELADELTFFKNECFVLKKQNSRLKQQIKTVKLDNQTYLNEIRSLKIAYEKKTKEVSHLRRINQQLKLSQPPPQPYPHLPFSQQQPIEFPQSSPIPHHSAWGTQLAQRWSRTQERSRNRQAANEAWQLSSQNVSKEEAEGKGSSRYSATPKTKFRSTSCSVRRGWEKSSGRVARDSGFE